MSVYGWDEIKERVKMIQKSVTELETSQIVLFGAGRSGSDAYKKIKKQYPVFAFCDNNKKTWGGTYEGLSVLSPEQLKRMEHVFVIITVTGQYTLSIKKQLKDIGIKSITYMEYRLIQNYDQFEMVYTQLLEDANSKKTYFSLLMSYLTLDTTYLKNIFVGNQYFEIPEFCLPSLKEVFVDCGAYTGDTLERYINKKAGTFRKIYAFEPTEKIVEALKIRKERLEKEWALEEGQIVIEKKSIASKSEIRYLMEHTEDKKWNRIEKTEQEGSQLVEAVSLDEYFADKKEKPTFLKADIEGAEMELLEGAERIITEQKPLLAICIYHKIEDLYEIPILLKQYNPNYKMSIRHHMPNYYETVLYCYE